jgi:hypothetical protein
VDLKGALAPVVKEHHAAITEPSRIGELLREARPVCVSVLAQRISADE